LLILLWAGIVNGQDPLPAECGMDSIYFVEQGQSSGQESIPENGEACFSPGGNHLVFTDLPRHTPSGERIKVRANFIIVQKQDGTGNFQDIPEHRRF
jgi:hypothetical protein